jgi:hypothetical protein
MKRWLTLLAVMFVWLGKQTPVASQTFLPDSGIKVDFEVGKPTVHLVIHPVGGIVSPPDHSFAEFAEYDIFVSTNPAANSAKMHPADWTWIRRTKPGETNLVLKNTWSIKPAFAFGSMVDSDNDGLPDAFEILVSKSNQQKYDSDGDGVCDADKMGPNGLPWNLEQHRRTEAVIYAGSTNATEGGTCGQCTVYLPSPAPAGGETVQYYLGGSAAPKKDFTINPANGAWNNYSLYVPAGASSGAMSICAVDDKAYSDMDRYVIVTLTGSQHFRVCPVPARVNIIDNDLPTVGVLALPPEVDGPVQVYGTNHIEFYFGRGGDSMNALTVGIALTGTAAFWNGRTNATASIKFPAGVQTYSLPVVLKQYKVDKLYDSITLKITSAPGYQIDPARGSAKIQIVNHDFHPGEKMAH